MSSKGQLGVAIAISMIMMGCCSNVFTLEMIVNHDAGAGHVVTFVQFAFVALEGVTSALTWNNGIPSLPKRHIPMTSYLVIVSMFFGLSVLNNKVCYSNIFIHISKEKKTKMKRKRETQENNGDCCEEKKTKSCCCCVFKR